MIHSFINRTVTDGNTYQFQDQAKLQGESPGTFSRPSSSSSMHMRISRTRRYTSIGAVASDRTGRRRDPRTARARAHDRDVMTRTLSIILHVLYCSCTVALQFLQHVCASQSWLIALGEFQTCIINACIHVIARVSQT